MAGTENRRRGSTLHIRKGAESSLIQAQVGRDCGDDTSPIKPVRTPIKKGTSPRPHPGDVTTTVTTPQEISDRLKEKASARELTLSGFMEWVVNEAYP